MNDTTPKVSFGGIELWRNRPFEIWHRPFWKINKSSHCPDPINCPYENHQDEKTDYDPCALKLAELLLPGTKILVLLEYAGRSHVCCFTVDRISKSMGGMPILSREESSNGYFFRPRVGARRSAQIHWYSWRYLAVVPNHAQVFGKYGKLACFKRELALISNLPARTIEAQIRILNNLNEPSPTLLQPVQEWARSMYEAFQEKDTVTLLREINHLAPSKRIADVAAFIMAVTQNGNFNELKTLLGNWMPPDPAHFNRALGRGLQWLRHYLPSENFSEWWDEWDQHFSIGKMPDINGPIIQVET